MHNVVVFSGRYFRLLGDFSKCRQLRNITCRPFGVENARSRALIIYFDAFSGSKVQSATLDRHGITFHSNFEKSIWILPESIWILPEIASCDIEPSIAGLFLFYSDHPRGLLTHVSIIVSAIPTCVWNKTMFYTAL